MVSMYHPILMFKCFQGILEKFGITRIFKVEKVAYNKLKNYLQKLLVKSV